MDSMLYPKVGEWYTIEPAGAMNSIGGPWRGHIRLGTENKVLVYFYGGGVSTDEYTAAPHGFYSTTSDFQPWETPGITVPHPDNPFSDWTVISVPYSTGDFHIGNAEFPYTDLDGSRKILHHNGYINYTGLMREAVKFIPQPDALLVCGFSAGGFAAALLADDVIENYFPDVPNVTVLCDSGILIMKDWRKYAENVWHAPREIYERVYSDNGTLDCLEALDRKYGDRVKVLFCCSVRDDTLCKFQAYYDYRIDVSKGHDDMAESAKFFGYMQRVVGDFRRLIPRSGIFLWDDSSEDDPARLTTHTIICYNTFRHKAKPHGKVCAQWLIDAVNGDVYSVGLDLVN